jgi:hypothetical protein
MVKVGSSPGLLFLCMNGLAAFCWSIHSAIGNGKSVAFVEQQTLRSLIASAIPNMALHDTASSSLTEEVSSGRITEARINHPASPRPEGEARPASLRRHLRVIRI